MRNCVSQATKWSFTGILLVMLCLLFAAQAQAFEVEVLRKNPRTIELAESVGPLFDEIEDQIGLKFDGKFGFLAFDRQDEFNEFASRFGGAHNDVLGIYIPPSLDSRGRGLPRIALNLSLIKEVGSLPATVLKHELCHAVLEENIPHTLRPLWFEEGLAQWVSETPVEAAMGALGYETGRGRDPETMYELSLLIRTPHERGVAYAHALAALRELEDDFGADGIRDFVLGLKSSREDAKGKSFASVFESTFESSYDEWAADFLQGRFRPWYFRLFQFFGRDVFSGMMIIGVILLVIAWFRKRKQEHARLEEIKTHDELYPSDGLWALSPKPEQIVDIDAIIAREEAERAAEEAREQESGASSLTGSASSFDDGDGYWTKDGWIQK